MPDDPLPAMIFEDVPLAEAFDQLAEKAGVRMSVAWDALEAQGITKDIPVRARVRNARFEKVLEIILDSATPDADPPVGYTVDDGVVVVTTRADYLARYVKPRRYDVSDLVVPRVTAEDWERGDEKVEV